MLGTNGSTSTPLTVTISNALTSKQNALITVAGVSVDDSEYAIDSQNCVGTLQPGAQCSVTLTYTPNAAGQHTGTLTIASDASNPAFTVPLKGAAKQGKLVVSGRKLNFGSVAVGSASQQKTVTLTNNNPLPVTISGMTLSNPTNYVMNTDCASSVPANGTCTIAVGVFTNAAGTVSGTLSISDDAKSSPQVIQLHARGM